MYVCRKFQLPWMCPSRDMVAFVPPFRDTVSFRIISCESPGQSRVQYFLKQLASLFIKHFPSQYILNWARSEDLDWISSVVAYMDRLVKLQFFWKKILYKNSNAQNSEDAIRCIMSCSFSWDYSQKILARWFDQLAFSTEDLYFNAFNSWRIILS
jgi:hypothetical protein